MGVDKPNYTQIPNLILDDLIMHMSGAELKVTLTIARQTFGYHRERFPMTISELETLTGLSRPAIMEAIDTGVRRNLIKRDQLEDGRWAYSLVVNGEVLAVGKESLPELVKKVDHDGGKESLPSLVKKVDRVGKKSLPKSVKKVDQNTPVLKKEKETSKEMVGGGDPTNQPRAAVAVNSPAHHALACALLIKVGVGGGTAKRLADLRSFEEIRKQVAGWLPDGHRGDAGIPALIWRIESGEWTAPELSADFKRGPLYLQFRTQDERDADEAAELEVQRRIAELEAANPPGIYRMPPAAVRVAPPKPQPFAHGDPWPICIVELCRELGDAYASTLEGSRIREWGTVNREGDGKPVPLYQVLITPERAAMGLNSFVRQAGRAIRMKLSSVLGYPVQIEIVAMEGEGVSA